MLVSFSFQSLKCNVLIASYYLFMITAPNPHLLFCGSEIMFWTITVIIATTIIYRSYNGVHM